jgi:hypothetical protein
VWAESALVEAIRSQLAVERATPQHARRKEADANRREKSQSQYVETFAETVRVFLAFHPRYEELARRLAQAVTEHATPVGSGTVARTRRIPVEQRAEAAVIAWMRHKTTAYEHMTIARVKGKRREVRRMLARQSQELLEAYRRGLERDAASCPLRRALEMGADGGRDSTTALGPAEDTPGHASRSNRARPTSAGNHSGDEGCG